MNRRLAAAIVLERSGAGRALRVTRAWRGLLVLCYHRILDGAPAPALPGPWSATQERFDRQLEWLTRHFDVVAPSELLAGPDLRRERLVQALAVVDSSNWTARRAHCTRAGARARRVAREPLGRVYQREARVAHV